MLTQIFKYLKFTKFFTYEEAHNYYSELARVKVAERNVEKAKIKKEKMLKKELELKKRQAEIKKLKEELEQRKSKVS